MRVDKGKCEECFSERLPEELYNNRRPRPERHFEYPNGRNGEPVLVWNPLYEEWVEKRGAVWDSMPEVWCVIGDDAFTTTVCLDHLGLQLKEKKE